MAALLAAALSLTIVAPAAGQARLGADRPVRVSQPLAPAAVLPVHEQDIGQDSGPDSGQDAPAGDPEGPGDPRDVKILELERRLEALEQAMLNQQYVIEQQARQLDSAADPLRRVPSPDPAAPRRAAQADTAPAIDDLLAERALERTLVRTGALLLRPGSAEIEPSLVYARQESGSPVFVSLDDAQLLARSEIRRDDWIAAVNTRVGLPFDAQLEAGIGFNVAESTERLSVAGSSFTETGTDGSGPGDIVVSVAKTLLSSQRGGGLPDLIGRVTWDTGSGESDDNGLSLSGGRARLGASLTAIARQDPLVFVGQAGYDTGFESDDIEEGDEVSVAGSALLAVSPDTSLRFGLSLAARDDVRLDGETLAGTDTQFASLSFGVSSILSRSTFIEASVDVGLTEDSPAYAVSVSTPIRLPHLFSASR